MWLMTSVQAHHRGLRLKISQDLKTIPFFFLACSQRGFLFMCVWLYKRQHYLVFIRGFGEREASDKPVERKTLEGGVLSFICACTSRATHNWSQICMWTHTCPLKVILMNSRIMNRPPWHSTGSGDVYYRLFLRCRRLRMTRDIRRGRCFFFFVFFFFNAALESPEAT